MDSIQELRCLVKQGTLSEKEANQVLGVIVNRMKDNVDYLEKNAQFGRTVGRALKDPKTIAALLSPVVLAGIGLGTNLISDVLQKEKENKDLRVSYQKMKKVRPEIADIPKEKVDEAFSVLSHVSPSIAKNPYLAANFVQRQAESYGGAGFEEAATLARTEQAMSGKDPMAKEVGQALLAQGIQAAGKGVGAAAASAASQLAEDPRVMGQRAGLAEASKYRELQRQDLSSLSKGQTPQDRARNKIRELVAERQEAAARGVPLAVDPLSFGEEAQREKLRGEAFRSRGLEMPRGTRTPFDIGEEAALADVERDRASRKFMRQLGRDPDEEAAREAHQRSFWGAIGKAESEPYTVQQPSGASLIHDEPSMFARNPWRR